MTVYNQIALRPDIEIQYFATDKIADYGYPGSDSDLRLWRAFYVYFSSSLAPQIANAYANAGITLNPMEIGQALSKLYARDWSADRPGVEVSPGIWLEYRGYSLAVPDVLSWAQFLAATGLPVIQNPDMITPGTPQYTGAAADAYIASIAAEDAAIKAAADKQAAQDARIQAALSTRDPAAWFGSGGTADQNIYSFGDAVTGEGTTTVKKEWIRYALGAISFLLLLR